MDNVETKCPNIWSTLFLRKLRMMKQEYIQFLDEMTNLQPATYGWLVTIQDNNTSTFYSINTTLLVVNTPSFLQYQLHISALKLYHVQTRNYQFHAINTSQGYD